MLNTTDPNSRRMHNIQVLLGTLPKGKFLPASDTQWLVNRIRKYEVVMIALKAWQAKTGTAEEFNAAVAALDL